jgi:hypothetical protein
MDVYPKRFTHVKAIGHLHTHFELEVYVRRPSVGLIKVIATKAKMEAVMANTIIGSPVRWPGLTPRKPRVIARQGSVNTGYRLAPASQSCIAVPVLFTRHPLRLAEPNRPI